MYNLTSIVNDTQRNLEQGNKLEARDREYLEYYYPTATTKLGTVKFVRKATRFQDTQKGIDNEVVLKIGAAKKEDYLWVSVKPVQQVGGQMQYHLPISMTNTPFTCKINTKGQIEAFEQYPELATPGDWLTTQADEQHHITSDLKYLFIIPINLETRLFVVDYIKANPNCLTTYKPQILENRYARITTIALIRPERFPGMRQVNLEALLGK